MGDVCEDVCEEVSGNNGNVKGLPILTISAANGWMNQKDRFSQVIAGNELKKYTLLEKGHLAYNHGNSKLAKYGTVFVQNLYDQALVPRVYHSFKMKTENNPYYVEYYFATKKLDRELARLVTSGARMDGLLNINKKDFFKIKFEVPTPVEQSLISTILQKLDQTITLHEEKKCLLERLKSALLQKMFADESGYPVVRFEGFSDEWVQRKLGDVVGEIQSGNRLPKASLTNGDVSYVVAQTKNDGVFQKIARGTLDYNGNPMKLFPGNSISFSIDNPEAMFYRNAEFYTSNIMRVIHEDHLTHEQYVFILENMKRFIRGYDWSRKFSGPVVSNLKYLQPSEEEQQKIGSFFKQLDDTIALHQQKINNINSVKKSLLQKMFI